MKVLVIGSTGLTGRLVVEKLLARGHEVTAMARNVSDWVEPPEGLKVVQGDARDAASLDRALQGQSVVFLTFGPRTLDKTDVQEVLMRNLVPLLRQHTIKRVINLSAWGALESRDQSNLVLKLLLRFTGLRHAYADKERGETLLLGSGVPFVNVRPGRLINTPARGGVRASLRGKGMQAVLTRADLAEFMVGQMDNDAWLNKSPLLGY